MEELIADILDHVDVPELVFILMVKDGYNLEYLNEVFDLSLEELEQTCEIFKDEGKQETAEKIENFIKEVNP